MSPFCRFDPRVPAALEVKVHLGDQILVTTATDISEGGLFAANLQAQPRQSLPRYFGVELNLPGEAEPVWAQCEAVVRSTPAIGGQALRFVAIASRDRERIAHYTSQYYSPLAAPVPTFEAPLRQRVMFCAASELLC